MNEHPPIITRDEFAQFSQQTFATLQVIQNDMKAQSKDFGELKADIRMLTDRTNTMKDAPARVFSWISTGVGIVALWISYLSSHRP